jgi:hypothetical protein
MEGTFCGSPAISKSHKPKEHAIKGIRAFKKGMKTSSSTHWFLFLPYNRCLSILFVWGKSTESTFPTPLEWSSDEGALLSPLQAVAERAAGTVESSQAGSILESGKMSACADIKLFSLQ